MNGISSFFKLFSFFLILLLVPSLAVQGASVVSSSPAQNELNVSTISNISATFSEAMNSATINDISFVVNASITGLHSGAIGYDSGSNTATFTPSQLFSKGEIVSVVLTTAIENSTGTPLANSYVWTFTISAGSGGSFLSRTSYAVGIHPPGLCAADLNSDSYPDIAVANRDSDNLSVLINNGDGSFAPKVDYASGDFVHSVAAADVDKDGDVDLISANGYSDNISVLMNNGDGTFAAQVIYAVNNFPVFIEVSDFNGDGHTDLAAANWTSAKLSILLNNGDGTFAAQVDYLTGEGPLGIYAADLDRDADIDLATSNRTSSNISVLLNNGLGVFSPPVDYPGAIGPRSVLAADLNADGHLELAASNEYSNDISVFNNNGNGTFAGTVNYSAGDGPYSVISADLNGDNDLDLIATNTFSNSLSLFSNDGSGTFNFVSSLPAGDGPIATAAADFNNDGSLDLAVAEFYAGTVSVYLEGETPPAGNSLLIPSISVFPCENRCVAVQPVQTSLIEPIKGASIPIEVPSGFVICSVSTQGLATEAWDIVVIDDDDWDDSGFIFVLFANTFGELIPAGVTPVFNIFFGAAAQCQQSYFVHWDTALASDPSRQLKFSDTLNMLIFPEFDSGADSTEIEGYVPGDFDTSGSVNILDLTAFVDRIFRGGGRACQLSSADNNGDCNGPDIADLTYLVDYIFRSGARPKCGCL